MLHLIAAEGPNGLHIPSDVNEVYWGSVAFFVVIALMAKLAGPAIKKSMRNRTEQIEADLAAARAEREAAEAALTASTADLPDTDEESARIRREAVETADRLKADLIAKAQVEAEEMRSRGLADVETYRRQSIAGLTSELTRITRESAEAIVVEQLDASTQGDLIERYITQVERLS